MEIKECSVCHLKSNELDKCSFGKSCLNLKGQISPKNKQHGGKRNGAGRKPARYQTKTISFRVLVEWENIIKELVSNKIQELKKSL